MLNKNAYAIMFGLATKAVNIPITRQDGSSATLFLSNKNSGYAALSSSHFLDMVYLMAFGTSNAAPSINDTYLKGDELDRITHTKPAFYLNINDGYAELQATVTITNGYTNSVTIQEVALFGELKDTTTASGLTFMFDRTIPATPITLAAGETKSITYNIRFTFPTA